MRQEDFFQYAQEKNTVKLLIENLIPPEHDQIYSDEKRLKQLLINLNTNAFKFTLKGSVTNTFKLINENNEDFIEISVKDTGIGINNDIIDKLGQPFVTSNDQECNPSGIGLGLFICNKIVSQLGPSKQLQIQSEKEKGSIFTFRISISNNEINNDNLNYQCFKKSIMRIKYQENFTEISEKSFPQHINDITIKKPYYSNQSKSINNICQNNSIFSSISPRQDQSKMTYSRKLTKHFLLVDDTKFNLIILERYVSIISEVFHLEPIISLASNGIEAVDLFKKFNSNNQNNDQDKIDIIIMDCLMPIMNGYTATQNIKQLIFSQQYSNVVIIGYTGVSGENEQQYCKDQGMDGYLLKPATQDDFINCIKDYLAI